MVTSWPLVVNYGALFCRVLPGFCGETAISADAAAAMIAFRRRGSRPMRIVHFLRMAPAAK
jgi:hypothetical protein